MAEEKKLGFFARLKAGLTKTRKNIVYNIDSVFNRYEEISEEFYEELEEVLIAGDLGVSATEQIMERLREEVIDGNYHKPAECKALLIRAIWQQMRVDNVEYKFEEEQSIVMIIGVNGVGKTTTIGKLASKLKAKGKKVIIAAADTFRAAATEQLAEWANRAGVEMVSAHEGADPASVVYDSVQSAKAKNADVLLIDTAGRLHNKKNLMAELEKMNRIIDREFPAAHRENLLVLDATTGQNALAQAREFATVTPLTGIILTKMDGSAKGGIAVAVQSELKIPVKYIGVGEAIEDLQQFDSARFVDALFDMEGATVSDKKRR
jgi:fused signal recognition particle receptor